MFYKYFCKNCNKEKEVEHSINENPEVICEECKNKMNIKIEFGAGIVFKGKGWYCKDNS